MEYVRRKFRETIEQYHMLRQGGRVVAAVSGGADSVCLLALLCGLRGELGIQVRAVHVHHGLRGAEADRDAEFARQLCERFEVPFVLRRVDVREFARAEKLSEEEAGRLLRYRAFEECAAAWESGAWAEEAGEGTVWPEGAGEAGGGHAWPEETRAAGGGHAWAKETREAGGGNHGAGGGGPPAGSFTHRTRQRIPPGG